MTVALGRSGSDPIARPWRVAPLTRHHRYEAGRRYDYLAAKLNADPRNGAARRELVAVADYLDRYARASGPIPWGWESVA